MDACKLIAAAIAAIALCSCQSMSYPVEGNNCLEWALANKKDQDRIVIGIYMPISNVAHAWLESQHGCRDNMRAFDCDDARYVKWGAIDAGSPAKL